MPTSNHPPASACIDIAEVDRIVAEIGGNPECVIPILQALQKKYHYLPPDALQRVCATTRISAATLTAIASFYPQFRQQPSGKHRVRVCIGTACYTKGASAVFQACKRFLGIDANADTDEQRLFTIEEVACLGCCMLAPAVQIDETIYGFIKAHTVSAMIDDFLKKNRTSWNEPVADRPENGLVQIKICLCSSCAASGAKAVYQELGRLLTKMALPAMVKSVACTGIAYRSPLIEIALPDGRHWHYGNVKPEYVRAILLEHLRPQGVWRRMGAMVYGILEKWVSDESWTTADRYRIDLRYGTDVNYLRNQHPIATEGYGQLEPLALDDYRRQGGWQALLRCLSEDTPKSIIAQIHQSGLRGRGGGGYPTAQKWEAVYSAAVSEKYLVCNGDEGDPGAFMDRLLMESFPLRVLEGIIIASYAVGASQGYFYIRAEYPLAADRIRQAIALCRANNLLGPKILGSDHSFDLKVVEGAGAFVCGEETALLAAIEGQRGTPRYRPPYPSQQGLWQKPTLINNVETFAVVPWILRHGPAEFAAIGSAASKGTKTFALAGKIVRSGLVEVPMGMSLQKIVEDIGGGVLPGHRLKAVQVGGPSGGCVPARLADTPVDYERLLSVDAIMGSGGLVVMDDSDCMVEIARYFLSFTQRESCGKCTFCRIGTRQMLQILEKICAGQGQVQDIEDLSRLAQEVREGSLCGLGRTAPNPVISTLRHFRDEYLAHIDGRCPAQKCPALIHYRIDERCIGCTRCFQQCAYGAIVGEAYQRHRILDEKCTRCDSCRQVCPVGAVSCS